MFTRLDSERNAKIMKRAVNDQKLDPDQYKVSYLPLLLGLTQPCLVENILLVVEEKNIVSMNY
jgi:hypothetical protein